MFSRRRFIKLAALAAVTHYTPVFARQTEANTPAIRLMDAAPATLGRATVPSLPIHAAPDSASPSTSQYARDDVFSILGQALGEASVPHNKTWFQTERGFVFSSWVQPVENQPQPAAASSPRAWGEICVPFSDARATPNPTAPVFYRLYYGSVFRAVGLAKDEAGTAWYLLRDGIRRECYIPAAHLRFIAPDELTPLSPEVKKKRIEVNATTNVMRAFEDDKIVMETRVATGKLTLYTFTPIGNFQVISKKPCSHMSGLWGTSDFYDLPGVPFATFFTARGAAIHGAYWHNDYGTHRSHGCVNVPPAIARWYWRWTTPAAPYDAASFYGQGTPIVVGK